ncbi:hypothetical protein RND81_05G201500 [Saponaria officinalis]|uniref:Ubiquitin carboxyl-terminal hydrolase n=1 Tax=Saponaria officinalis TaxID=3572 RepID=A0AAW1L2N6_SAPOF
MASAAAASEKATPSLRKVEFHLARKPESFSLHVNPNFKLETLNPNSPFKSSLVPCSQSSSSSSAASFNSRKSDPSDFFEDAVLAFRMPLRRIGAGLENLGNTCFLNSVIQCLTYTEPLVGYLQSGKHQTTCRVAGFCALCAIQKHVSRALQSSGRSLAPKDLVSHLRCVSRNFRNARQEDAHEYMIHLLESMHKCCLPSGVQAESPGAYEKSLVHRIFGGRLRSQVKCLQCSHCSNTFDPFLDLSLEIVKADSLYKALRHFTAPEQLDGGERQYKCEKCKQKVRALKQLTVSKAPYVLTIHLKRFRSHFSGQKIDKKVQFGSTLDLKPFVTGDYEGDLTYTLYGVLVHAGYSTHSGHYYCFVRTSNGLWYSLDDNRVIQVSERIVMEQKAYMLFYVRDRKKFVSKKAMDMVQKENLITAMRNVANSSVPSANHAAAERNTNEITQSSLSVEPLKDSKSSEIVVQSNSSKSLMEELNHNSGKVLSKPSVSENNNSSIPKPNLDEMIQSTTCVENSLVKISDETTVLVSRPEDKNIRKSDPVLPNEKTTNLNCSTTVASGLGDIAFETVKDKIPVTVTPSNSTIQENAESKKFEDAKVRKSRIKGRRVDKLTSRQDLQRRGLVKTISKSGSLGMHLSTKMLYHAALSLSKKKQCKRVKQQKLTLHKNVLNKETVPMNMKSSISVASTSVEISAGIVNGFCSRDGEKGTSNSPLKKSNVVLKSEAKSSQTILASDKLSKETVSLEAQNVQSQNGILKVTNVGSWGGLEVPSEKSEDNGPEIVTIGHVLDEWDEEYDRGKRKKVRGPRTEFGGPNLFQEISSKKARLQAKKKQRISINEPFRI